jgi:predicted Zn-dependent protease
MDGSQISFLPFWRRCCAALTLVVAIPTWVAAPALAQPVGLPSMGSTASAELSPLWERRLGDSIIAQGRRDPTYVHDAEINQYLNAMGHRLAQYASGGPPDIDLFGVRDPMINAFAMPGGYIGINTGLIVQSGSESELAGVVAHEIAHVTQRHIARGLTQRKQSDMIAMASIAAALLGALTGGAGLAMGLAAFGQAAAIDRQLGFSRDAEREADRVGFHMLSKAGYDPNGMQEMFSKLMTASNLNMGSNGGNSYLSTHPLSIERMTDMQNRTRSMQSSRYRDSDAFWYVRARSLVLQTTDRHGLTRVVDVLQDTGRRQQGIQRSAAWLGLADLATRRKQFDDAERFLNYARQGMPASPYLARQAADLALARGDANSALAQTNQGLQTWPNHMALAEIKGRALLALGRYRESSVFLAAQLKRWPTQSMEMHQMLAHSFSAENKPIEARLAMADYYVLTGAFPAAMAQLQQARGMIKDFREQSRLDVQIREVTQRMAQEREVLERFKG